MDTAAFLFESVRVVFSFLLLLFVPGFALSLVIFPRFTDLSTIDRLVYSIVLSISSCIASVVFIDIVPGLDVTLDTFILVISVFSLLLVLFWSAERYYLNSHLKKKEPKTLKDNQDLQKYHSRGINATKDRFREDTRTVVVYHESGKSGISHIGHSFLIDLGEEIDIQQVAENKLNVNDRYVVDPPYPKTRYFEVIIREYNDNGLSQVDDLQIYPVLITKNPIRSFPGPAPQPGTLEITERIYQKTNNTEIQWIYSHDFHIFAILHAEDTLNQMVDLILGKLDEIVTSLKGEIQSFSSQKDRQVLKNELDTVSDNLSPTLSQTVKISRQFEFRPGVHSKSNHERPLILPGDQLWDIPEKPEIHIRAEPKEIPPGKFIQPNVQQKERPESLEIQPRGLPVDIQKHPILQTFVEPQKVPLRPGVPPQVEVKDILKHPENKLVVDSIRKLQKDILRDLDMFNLTTESFKRSRKNIENIQIPKKADVKKKLADAEGEMRDLDWLYE
jgi:hypothetical protein